MCKFWFPYPTLLINVLVLMTHVDAKCITFLLSIVVSMFLSHLGHGFLVHVVSAVVVVGEQSVSLQRLQGFGGVGRAVLSLQSLRSGSVRLQQADDVLSGLERHNTVFSVFLSLMLGVGGKKSIQISIAIFFPWQLLYRCTDAKYGSVIVYVLVSLSA